MSSLPPGVVCRIGCTRLRMPNDAGQLAFSQDGKWLVSYSGMFLTVWDTSTGEVLRRIQAECSLSDMRFSPDGAYFVCCGILPIEGSLSSIFKGVIIFHSLPDWNIVRRIPVPRDIAAMTFAPHARQIVCAGQDQYVRAWTYEGDLVFEKRVSGWLSDIEYSPTGECFATTEGPLNHGCIGFLSPKGAVLGYVDVPPPDDPNVIVREIEFSPDGSRLYASGDKFFLILDVLHRRVLDTKAKTDGGFVAVSKNPHSILLPDRFDTVVLNPNQEETGRLKNARRPVLSPDGSLLAHTRGSVIRIHEYPSLKERVLNDSLHATANKLSFLPGNKLIQIQTHGEFYKCDVRTGQIVERTTALPVVGVTSTDGAFRMACKDDCNELWSIEDILNPRHLWNWPGARHVKFLGSKHALVRSNRGYQWTELFTGHPSVELCGNWHLMLPIAISQDERLFAGPTCDDTIQIHSLQTGELLREVSCTDFVEQMQFSPDGKALLVIDNTNIGDGYRFRAINVETGELLFAPIMGLTTFGISEHHDLLLTVEYPFLEFRRWSTAKSLGLLELNEYILDNPTFSSDGKLLATACGDTTVLIWDVDETLKTLR